MSRVSPKAGGKWNLKSKRKLISYLAVYLIASLALVSFSVWWLSVALSNDQPSIAIINFTAHRAEAHQLSYYDILFSKLVEQEDIRVLSANALQSHNETLYPVLQQKFGVDWVVELNLRSNDKNEIHVVTSLVEANSGYVAYRQAKLLDGNDDWHETESQTFVTQALDKIVKR